MTENTKCRITNEANTIVGSGWTELQVPPDMDFQAGDTIRITATRKPANWMVGKCSYYQPGSSMLAIQPIENCQGSGTYTDWTIERIKRPSIIGRAVHALKRL